MRSWGELALLAALVSCGDEADEACPPDSDLTWSTFGDPFVRSWCTGCHSSALAEPDRQGAPVGVDLDTLEGVRAHLADVRRRAVREADMPPAGGPDEGDRALLDEWLACGAPGVDDGGPAEPIDPIPTVPETGCSRVGRWVLSGASCRGVDVTAQWTSMFALTELVVTDAGDTCAIEYHLADAGCDERQQWRSDMVGPTSEFAFLGTVSCEPLSCSWAAIPGDVCQVLADPITETVPVLELADGAVGLGPLAPPDLASFCDALGLVFLPVDG